MNQHHTPGDGLGAPTRGKFGALETIKEATPAYAKAKAARVYLEQFRKSKKALLMIEAEKQGHKTGAMQERYAYAHPDYNELLLGLQSAVEEEERLRFVIESAKLAIEIWRTKSADQRAEARAF